jgi:peptide deformylase
MSLRIARLGQPVLRRIADPVPIDDISSGDFQAFLDLMSETLAKAKGVGLAAPQVFVSRRVFLAAVVDPDESKDLEVEVFINPTLSFPDERVVDDWEGCLSFRELTVKVPRRESVIVDYLDRHGSKNRLELTGYPARVVQHEYDHLDGVLIIDRAASTHDIILASELNAVEGDPAADE